MGKEKVLSWIEKNWILVGIIIFSLAVRIYYFFITQGQVVWWDSSEYMLIAQRFAFGIDYSFGPVRPLLLSLVTALFLKINNSEFLIRIFILILSVGSVIGMYYLGREFFEKKVGLVASFLMSIFYLNLFFTYRILTEIPSLAFFIFSAYFFYRYFKEEKPRDLYVAAVLIAIGALFKLSTAFILIPCLIYLLVTEGLSFLKKKEIWIASGIFILIFLPYLIWGYFEFGGFVLTQASGHVAPTSYFNGFTLLKNYLLLFPTYFSWPLLIAFIFGLSFMYKIILYPDRIIYGNPELRRDFFLFLLFIIPLVLISFLINHNENRYIMIVFPSVFIIASSFLVSKYDLLKRHNKVISFVLLLAVVLFVAFFQITSADGLIKSKAQIYIPLKDAGIWLKQNSLERDIIVTRSQPQIRYYSERQTVGIPETRQEFEEMRTEDMKFFILSVFESNREWSINYPFEENLTVVQAYIAQDDQPILIIYKLSDGNI